MLRLVVHATAITARTRAVPGTRAHAPARHGAFGASLGVHAATAAVATAAAGTGRATVGTDTGAGGGRLVLGRCGSIAGIEASAGSFGAFAGGKGAEAQEADGCGNQVGGTHDVLLDKRDPGRESNLLRRAASRCNYGTHGQLLSFGRGREFFGKCR
jgi:hypothetical protein